MFMGHHSAKWDCALGGDMKTQDTCIRRLRYKYLCKLLLTEFNIVKDDFMVEYKKLANMEKFTRIKLVDQKLKGFCKDWKGGVSLI